VCPQTSFRLELLATHAAGLVVYVWTEDLVLHQVVDGLKVFIALVAIVMLVTITFVSSHTLLSSKILITVLVSALDAHLGLLPLYQRRRYFEVAIVCW
jgi:hypothetical protein